MMPVAEPANSATDRLVEQIPDLLDRLSNYLENRKKKAE